MKLNRVAENPEAEKVFSADVHHEMLMKTVYTKFWLADEDHVTFTFFYIGFVLQFNCLSLPFLISVKS